MTAAGMLLVPLWGMVGLGMLNAASGDDATDGRDATRRDARRMRRMGKRRARAAARAKRRAAQRDEGSPLAAVMRASEDERPAYTEEEIFGPSMPPPESRRGPRPSPTSRSRMRRSRARRPEMTDEEKARQAARTALAERLTAMRPLARRVAADIRDRKYDYSRAGLQRLQREAGLKPDGIYGGASAGMLRAVLGQTPPRPLFKPTTEVPYAG